MKHIFEYLFSKKSDLDKIKLPKQYGILRDKDIIIASGGRYIVLFDKNDILQAMSNMTRQDVFDGGMLYKGNSNFNLVTYYDPNTLKNIYSGFGDIEQVYRCKKYNILKKPIDDILADFDEFRKYHWELIWRR